MKKLLIVVIALFGTIGCSFKPESPQVVAPNSAQAATSDPAHDAVPDVAEAEVIAEQGFELYFDDQHEKAIPLLKQAALTGHADAECRLGIIYELGEGVDVDHQAAFEWFKKSAEHGGVGGLYRYGRCFHKGIGTEVDLHEALKWYRQALGKGNRIAGFSIDEVEAELNP